MIFKRSLTFAFFLSALIGFSPAQGQDVDCTSVASGNWESSGTWNCPDGNNGYPDATDENAIIDGHGVSISPSNTPDPLVVGDLTIKLGRVQPTSSFTGGSNRTVAFESVTIEKSSSTQELNLTNADNSIDLTVKGLFSVGVVGSSGSAEFNPGNRTVTLDGGTSQSVEGSLVNDSFYNLVIDGDNTDVSFDSEVRVTNNLVLDEGGNNSGVQLTLNTAGNGLLIEGAGELDDNTSGGFNVNGTKITLDPDQGSTINVSGSNLSFAAIDFTGPTSGTGAVQLQNSVSITGRLDVVSNTTFQLQGNTANLSGNLINDGTISSTGGVLDFQSGGSQSLDASGTTIAPVIVSSGSTVNLTNQSNPLTISGSLTLNNGTFDGQSATGRTVIQGNLDVNDGALILSDANGGDLDVTGDFEIDNTNGSFNARQRVVRFNGSSSQTIGGAGELGPTFFDVVANNSSGITISSSTETRASLRGNLNLMNGTFTTNGLLNLRSERISASGSRDAGIVENGGSFASSDGDRMERFISDGSDSETGPNVGDASIGELGDDAGYRLISPPIGTNLTASNLVRTSNGQNDDQLIEDVPVGSMIYRYDPVDANGGGDGFLATGVPNGNTDGGFTLEPGRGYLVFFFDDTEDPINDSGDQGLTFENQGGNALADLTSTPKTVEIDLTGNSGDFHLIGNPYPGVYDLSEMTLSSGSFTDEFKSTVDIVKPDGTERNPDVSSSPANVAAWQGFYIEESSTSSGGTVTIEFPSSGLVGGSASENLFEKSASSTPGFRLALKKEVMSESSGPDTGGQAVSVEDYSLYRFRSEASSGLDNFDSREIVHPLTAPSRTSSGDSDIERAFLSTLGTRDDGSTIWLDKDTRPQSGAGASDPIVYDVAFECANLDSDATYVVDLTEASIPSDWEVALTDTQTDQTVALYSGGDADTYSFTVSSEACGSSIDQGSGTARFRVAAGPTPLPVELNGFNGSIEGQDAVLTWETASETNNAGFQVQQKRDGQFQDLQGAFVESKASGGTTSQPQSYRYRVTDLDAGTHTFRLKQVDTDGTESFTDPIDVEVGLDGQYSLSTYPNPVQDQATVKFAVKEQAEVTISLYNTLGQRVKTLYRDTPPAEQTQRATITTDDLSSGLYIVRLRGESFTATQRVTVVK